MRRGQVHQRPALLTRDGGPRGVVEVRDGVDELRHASGIAGGCEGVHVHAVVLHRDRQDLHAVHLRLQQRAVIRGRLEGDQVARRQEGLEQEHVPLERPVGDEHAVGRGAVVRGQPLAQRGVSATGPVGEDDRRVVLQRGSGATGDEAAIQGLGGRGAAGERDHVRHAGECRHTVLPIACATGSTVTVVCGRLLQAVGDDLGDLGGVGPHLHAERLEGVLLALGGAG